MDNEHWIFYILLMYMLRSVTKTDPIFNEFLQTFIGLSKGRDKSKSKSKSKSSPFMEEQTCRLMGLVAATHPEFASRISHEKLKYFLTNAFELTCGKRFKGGSASARILARRNQITRKSRGRTMKRMILFFPAVLMFLHTLFVTRATLEELNRNPVRAGKFDLLNRAVAQGTLSDRFTKSDVLTTENMKLLWKELGQVGPHPMERLPELTRELLSKAEKVSSSLLEDYGVTIAEKVKEQCIQQYTPREVPVEPMQEETQLYSTWGAIKGRASSLADTVTGALYGFSETALDTAERMAWATMEASNLERTQACIFETTKTETLAYKRGLEDQVEKIKTVLRNYTSRGRTNLGVVLGLLWKAFALFMASLMASRKMDQSYANAARLEGQNAARLEEQEIEQAMESMAVAIQDGRSALEQPLAVQDIQGRSYNANELGEESPPLMFPEPPAAAVPALGPALDQRGGVPTPEYEEARRRANAMANARRRLNTVVAPAANAAQRARELRQDAALAEAMAKVQNTLKRVVKPAANAAAKRSGSVSHKKTNPKSYKPKQHVTYKVPHP